MESIKEIMNNKYQTLEYKLEKNFDYCLKQDPMFAKLVTSLKLPNKYLMKYTSKLEDSAKELSNCRDCKNLFDCKNTISGYVYYPEMLNENLVFNYVPCKYKKKLDKENSYRKNIFTFNIPKNVITASMKEIYTEDKSRLEAIKWIKKYIDNYKKGIRGKGLYLTGNFGSGKTYLLCAMMNELAKNNAKIAIVYYPELLHKLKESFREDDNYGNLFNKIKKIEILLIDDIGAETMTPWSRDEVLGTILQYRMEEELPTFFTSNFTIEELEEHLSISGSGVERVKARRIIERIRQQADSITMVSENKRK